MSGFKKGNFQLKSGNNDRDPSLPARIECAACGREKDIIQFSNRQLESIRLKAISGRKHAFGPKGGLKQDRRGARCRQCTGTQTSELLCVSCGKVKDLSEFANQQRKRPDDAKCTLCMEEVVKVGENDAEDDELQRMGTAYEDIADGDFGDYLGGYYSDGGRSETSGISNPWATKHDGDYVTTSDVQSGRWAPEATTKNYKKDTSNSKYHHGELSTGNVWSSQPPSAFESSHFMGQSTSSRLAGSASNPTEAPADASGNREWPELGGDFGSDNSQRSPKVTWKSSEDNNGRTFNAWGPDGQSATHYRSPSSVTSISTNRENNYRTTERRRVKPESSSNRKFAKVRPENNFHSSNRRFAKVRPENFAREEEVNVENDGEYYDLSKASSGTGDWDEKGSHW